jgi:predicted RNase H-like HicB family nuclease
MQYLVIIEGDDTTGYGAYVPDLPGCIAAAETREEVEQLIREAVPFHLEGMAEVGDRFPPRRVVRSRWT